MDTGSSSNDADPRGRSIKNIGADRKRTVSMLPIN